MKFEKYETILQKLQYSKLYRLPLWCYYKLKYRKIDANKEQVTQMRLGHKIFLHPTQTYLKNVLINRQYHDENIFLVKQFLKTNPVIFDIGANIGLYTCAYAQHFKDLKPTIIAVEAIDTNYQLLKKNIESNHFKNILTYNIALGDSPGFLEFNLPSSDFVGNVAGNNVTKNEKNMSGTFVKKVKLDTLDHLTQENDISRCDYMKVDIEGAELFFFKGAKEFIKKTRPVIQFEYNKHWLENNAITFSDFYDFFSPLDYAFFLEAQDAFTEITNVENYTITNGLIDLLIIPQEKIGVFYK